MLRNPRRVFRAIVLLIVPLVALLGATVLNGLAVGDAGQSAAIQHVAERQSVLLNRYLSEVFLQRTQPDVAEPEQFRQQLQVNANALLNGGIVEGFQGSGHGSMRIERIEDAIVLPKIRQGSVLLKRFLDVGLILETGGPQADDPQVLDEFRVRAAALSSNMRDVAGEHTAQVVASGDRLVRRQIVLALLGTLAIALAIVLQGRRATADQQRYFKTLVEGSTDLVVLTDNNGVIAYASQSVASLFGMDPVGERLTHWVAADDIPAVRRAFEEATLEQVVTLEHAVRIGDLERQLESKFRRTGNRGGVRGVVVNARDITDRKALEARLTDQAYTDPLTLLPNRAMFLQRLDEAVDRGHAYGDGTVLGVVFADLDGFKSVNDSFGHAVGDELIATVALRLRGCVRSSDVVARLGGDEFAVLIEAPEPAVIERVAETIADRLGAPYHVGGRELVSSASVGVDWHEGRAARGDHLLRNADMAMYAAKVAGGGHAMRFHSDMHDLAVRQQRLADEMRSALANNELDVAYQPIVSTSPRRIVKLEALARWTNPTLGVVPPSVFVPVAEQIGTIHELGAFMLRRACVDAVAWRRDVRGCRDVGVNVNVSLLQARDPGLTNRIATILVETGLPAGALTIELTESTFADEAVLPTVAALQELGVRISMDDFGTGYSSLSQLRRLPVDELKIDREFIVAATTEDGQAVVSAIVAMAGALGLDVVAEGIETEEQERSLPTDQLMLQGRRFAAPIDDSATLYAALARYNTFELAAVDSAS